MDKGKLTYVFGNIKGLSF